MCIGGGMGAAAGFEVVHQKSGSGSDFLAGLFRQDLADQVEKIERAVGLG